MGRFSSRMIGIFCCWLAGNRKYGCSRKSATKKRCRKSCTSMSASAKDSSKFKTSCLSGLGWKMTLPNYLLSLLLISPVADCTFRSPCLA